MGKISPLVSRSTVNYLGFGNETVTLGPLVLLATRLVWTFNKTQSSSRLGSEVRLPSAAAVSLQGNFIGTSRRSLLSLAADGKTCCPFGFVCS